MLNKNLFFILSILLFFIINSKTNNTKLTQDYLISTNWGQEYSIGLNITFNENHRYEGTMSYGMDADQKKGSYELINGKLILYIDDTHDIYLRDGILKYDENSVRFKYYIEFNDGTKILNLNSTVPAGKSVMIDSYKAITMGQIKGEPKDNIKFRNKPDINSKIILFERLKPEAETDLDFETLEYVPSGTKIIILARTKDKAKIKNWTNYWYYVEVPADPFMFTYNKGWMFGEFINILK